MIVLRAARVTLRRWRSDDGSPFAALNADARVMRYITAPLSRTESDALAERIARHIETRGWGLWALDVPGLAFAGFVGLASVPFELPLAGFPPPVHEIGWRLAHAAWGHGYASEAATLALQDARERLRLALVVSFTARLNEPSQRVMQRIGPVQRAHFQHPRLAPEHALALHVLYTT